MMTQSTAVREASIAAQTAFENYLISNKSTATIRVPECVIDAANKAYAGAYGYHKIEVIGHGNRTHPVCSVEVREIKSKKSK